ncbi:MAG TPA: prepilin-type N-terminal cleavage/methylation domain-containing protein [Kofleriaceae bacterium]|jgi:prepilin-type N-terminal cleavage/methylation domain-containing protein
MRRGTQRGFTLIEIMITVAIIAILAAIAIPMFSKEKRKTDTGSETAAMFGELAIRQDQYKLENGFYLATAACPATTIPQGTDATSCITGSGAWVPLKVRLPRQKLICTYTTTIGTGTGATAPTGFTFTSPTGAWFYIVATCDADGVSSVNAQYFVSSVNSTIQKTNEGR